MDTLHAAACLGDCEKVRRFLAAGALVNQRDRSGETALHDAARNGHTEICTVLLDAGALPNVGNTVSRTPLHAAVANSHISVIRALLAAGASPNAADSDGRTPFHYAAMTRNQREVVRILFQAGADPYAKDTSGAMALKMAAVYGNLDAVEELLDAGFNPNVANAARRGQGALHLAAQWGHHELLAVLMQGGAIPNYRSPDGRTAADVAKAHGDPDGAAMIQAVADLGLAALRRRVLTVKGSWASPDLLELNCTTLAGNVAATLMWPDSTPMSKLPQTVIDAVKASGFQGLQEPLEVYNLSLLKPGRRGVALNCQVKSHSLSKQLGLQHDS